MKRILITAFAALAAFSAQATTLSPVQLLNPTGSTSGQAIVSTGSSTAPAWGNVTATSLAAQAANTVLANVTASSASPTAFVMPSCSTSTSALQYTSGTGFTCYASSATTTGTLAQFAATTSAQLAGVLSDETGSGAVVFGTSPTIGTATINTPTISGGTINNATVGLTTPLAAKFTTLQATAAITPSSTAGIVGTATNDNANAGSIGEFPSPTNLSAVSLTTGVAANVSSISLGAGDWNVQCNALFSPAPTTTGSGFATGVSTTSVTFGASGSYSGQVATMAANTGTPAITSPLVRVPLSTTTTVYCIASSSFAVSTMTASGFMTVSRRR